MEDSVPFIGLLIKVQVDLGFPSSFYRPDLWASHASPGPRGM
jgi:hypothetical protein